MGEWGARRGGRWEEGGWTAELAVLGASGEERRHSGAKRISALPDGLSLHPSLLLLLLLLHARPPTSPLLPPPLRVFAGRTLVVGSAGLRVTRRRLRASASSLRGEAAASGASVSRRSRRSVCVVQRCSLVAAAVRWLLLLRAASVILRCGRLLLLADWRSAGLGGDWLLDDAKGKEEGKGKGELAACVVHVQKQGK